MTTTADVITGLALSGGGANAHSFLTGLFAGLYQSAQLSGQPDPLTGALGNTSVVSTNSGSSWFISEAGWSSDFVSKNISSGGYGKQNTWLSLVNDASEARQKLATVDVPTDWLKEKKADLLSFMDDTPLFATAIADAVVNGNLIRRVSDGSHSNDYGSWNHFVYNYIINNDQVRSNNLSSPALGWLDKKTVIMSTGIQNDVPLISLAKTTGLFNGLTTYFWTDNVYNNNKYDVVPLSIASKHGSSGSRVGEVSFTNKDLSTNISYISTDGFKSLQPFSESLSTQVYSAGNANTFGLINASSMSSAGAGSIPRLNVDPASPDKKVGSVFEIVAANNLRELSPMIQFSYNKERDHVMASEDITTTYKPKSLLNPFGGIDLDGTKSNLFAEQPARTVDGGYFDNTTVATNLRQLLKEDPAKSFRITAWVNDYGDYEELPGQITRLFDVFTDIPNQYPPFKDPFGTGLVNVPSIGVFSVDKGSTLQDSYKSTKQVIAKSPDESISIERFEVDVITQTNPLFDIEGGRTGKVIFYHAQNTKSGLLPNQANIGELENNYNLAFEAFKDNSQFYQDFHSGLI